MPQINILAEKDTLRNTQSADAHTFRQTALFSRGNTLKYTY